LLKATQNHQRTTSKNVKTITFSCSNNNYSGEILALEKSKEKSQLPLTFQASPFKPPIQPSLLFFSSFLFCQGASRMLISLAGEAQRFFRLIDGALGG